MRTAVVDPLYPFRIEGIPKVGDTGIQHFLFKDPPKRAETAILNRVPKQYSLVAFKHPFPPVLAGKFAADEL